MKKILKNETDVLGLINKIQAQLISLEAKVDTLINRSLPATKPSPKPSVNERVMYKVICADCNKDCTIPFKPSGDRPVYCQDCFSRRKVIRLSGLKVETKPIALAPAQAPVIKTKKKAVTVKKTIGKKKSLPKKK